MDPLIVLKQIANLKLVYPEIWDEGDEQLLIDSLQGETELNEFLKIIVDRMLEAIAFSDGINLRIKELEERQSRYFRRENAMRDLAFKLMSAAEVRKIELPEATLSVVKGQRKLIGEADPNQLPDNLVKVKREPNRTAIKSELEAGRTVPGFELSNAEPHLAIRTR